jgi:hypothetical protein
MKWLVIWIIIQTSIVPCEFPDNQPHPEIVCFEETKSQKFKEFKTIDEAREWVEMGQAANPTDLVFGDRLVDFKIYELQEVYYDY